MISKLKEIFMKKKFKKHSKNKVVTVPDASIQKLRQSNPTGFRQPLVTGGIPVTQDHKRTPVISSGRKKFWEADPSLDMRPKDHISRQPGEWFPGIGSRQGSYNNNYTPTPVVPAQSPEVAAMMKKVLADSETTSRTYIRDTYVPSHSLVEYVAASDGLFKVNNHKVFNIINKIADVDNKNLDAFLTGRNLGFNLLVPKIPFEALQIIYSFFFDIFEGVNNTSAESEAMAQVFFAREGYREIIAGLEDEVKNGIIEVNDQFFVFIPEQSISHASVTYNRSAQLEGNFICVLDIHSHDSMSAFFSGIDDNDEKEPRFYGVLGGMPWASKEHKCWAMRYQTKESKVHLERFNSDFFDIFEKPQMQLQGVSPAISAMFNRGSFDSQTLLKFYAEQFGRVVIAPAILDRCKLRRQYGYAGGYTTGYTPYKTGSVGFNIGDFNRAQGAQRQRTYKDIYEADEDFGSAEDYLGAYGGMGMYSQEDLEFWRDFSKESGIQVQHNTQESQINVTEEYNHLEQALADLKEHVPITTIIDIASSIGSKRGVRAFRQQINQIAFEAQAFMKLPKFSEDDLALSFDDLVDAYSEGIEQTDGIQLQEDTGTVNKDAEIEIEVPAETVTTEEAIVTA